MDVNKIKSMDIEAQVYELISNVTGHKVEDLDSEMFLESDLGIDSIKMVNLMNQLMKLIPTEELDNFIAVYPMTHLMSLQTIEEIASMFEAFFGTEEEMHNENADKIIKIDIKAQVFEIISNVTGHKIVDLDLEMFLESDLGIDSIKMVNLMNQLIKLIPDEELNNFTDTYPMTYLMSLQTVDEIISMFEEFFSEKSSKESQSKELEILNAQYPFLASYWSVGTLTICSGVKIEGELNLELLRDSWLELVKRHPSLSSSFTNEAGVKSFKDYKLEIQSDLRLPKIQVEDVRELPVGEQTQKIKGIIEDIINKPFDIFRFPLHKFLVVETDYNKFELIFANNHLVSDGLGNQQIMREIIEIYSSKISGKNSNLSHGTSMENYNKVVSEINNWNSLEENKNLEKYIRAYGKTKYRFNPFNKGKVKNEFATVKTQKYWVNKDITKRLLEKSKAWRVSLFTLMVAAYLKAINDMDKENNEVIINLPTSGKVYPNIDATGIIGCFAQNMALNFNLDATKEEWKTVVEKIDNEIREKIYEGIDRAQINSTAKVTREQDMLEDGEMSKMTAAIIRSSLKSNLYLSFVGNTELQECYGSLKIVDYEAYTSTNAGAIDNLVEIFKDQIMITSNYDSVCFDGDNIKLLIEKLINNLNDMANSQLEDKVESLNREISENNVLIDELMKISEEVCLRSISKEDIHKDLGAEFGVDSLQVIRIITKVSKLHKGIDREALFKCRTLNEMALIIQKNISSHESKVEPVAEITDNEEIPYMKIVKQCKLTPDAIAIFYKDEKITYRELDEESNKIANYLMNNGIKRNSLVGIMVFPGPMMLIGMIGIMKAGAAYVPVDPAYPTDRIQYIMKSAGIEILLTEHDLKETLSELIEKDSPINTLVYLDYGKVMDSMGNYNQVPKEMWLQFSEASPKYINSPDDLMTILYTSGSTGNPKGVMLAHRGYMNRLIWHQDTFKLKEGERVAQKTSCCFDISVWELFWPLMYGGAVCPIRKEIVKNPWGLAKWLIETKINIMHFVPSLFGEFVNSLEDDDYEFKDLRWLIFSGEALPMPTIQKWIDKHGLATGLANLYGPTEASIDVTCHIIDRRPGDKGENTIPIGKPITNVFIKALDENMKEVPDGEIGELWIGGIQLAKGYKNNKEKTEEAFKPNPFKEIPGEYLYKTGDLTTKLSDGSFDYLGRIDNQVKIRGFRVELGEIEAVLGAHPSINEAAVIAVDYIDGQKQLIAWVSGNKVDDNELKEFISKKLTYYMIPHRFEWLAILPKTPNGKLDRKALNQMYDKSTTGASSIELEAKEPETQEVVMNEIPLSPAQKFLINYFDYPYQWTGYTRFLYKQPLDFEMFNKALTIVTNNYDALRCVLVKEAGKWMQRFLPENQEVEADYYDGSHMDDKERDEAVNNLINEIIGELEVDKWPLWKVVIIKVSDSAYDISVIGHHLMSDLIGNQLLFKRIWSVYGQLISGANEVKLEEQKSYKDFVVKVNKEKENKAVEFVRYYKELFPSELSAFKISEDFNLGENTEVSAKSEIFTLDKAETIKLQTTAKKFFRTSLYNILLAPLYKMLQKQYNKSWVVVSHRMNGRELGNETFFETVGNFAINYPVGIKVEYNEEWSETVKKIENGMNQVPLKGISYDLVSDELPSYMYPDLNLTSIRANYLGNRDITNYDVFEFSKEGSDRRYSHPKQKRISSIELFFSIVNGELLLEIEYSKNMYEESTIRQLGEAYINTVKEMINYIQDEKNSMEEKTLKPISFRSKSKKQGTLSGKVVIITGGGRGIGRTIAIEMAKEDAQVVIISRTISQLKETQSEIEKFGGRAISIAADISDYNSVEKAVNKVISEFGKIDVLVNNAGITKLEGFTDTNMEEWKKIVEVNLFGTYNMCKLIVPYLSKQKSGKIINLGSDSSFIGYPLMSAYSASKHAVLGLTKSLAEELKLSNIQVNAICPSFVETDMTPGGLRNSAMPTEKVADLAIFLASDKSDYITGEAIKIYGKQDMYWFGAKQMQAIRAVVNRK
ncbi:non-ribosomal peptide synthetase [Clostridium saccharoperbutylacetonicum]|uniref:non-ribosomal peptide synthetase n=1 Tax=Clostridium saccharoperbutylacetonicum TaxID=36745 RepID=UPI000983DDE9|nr:non-ribosomal peptide synthetase [Clostridium saccharoperbutylacetonicum]AQR95352.1 tyrocidine synthase 1 [Clostridium saccharoperbutylacetonicum]NSB31207.1 amino acid adenylation domain-containing protein/non-ribosomal peptide synthase protein (TIGR01720 family) [Clostridium saccharoperbutylacetonicum]